MSVKIAMPKLGFDMESGIIVHWLKKKGDYVETGKPFVEIETDKATIEVEAFSSGTLTHILVEEGQSAKVGEVIALLDGEAESKSGSLPADNFSTDATREATVPTDLSRVRGIANEKIAGVQISPLARRIAREKDVDLSQLKGTGPREMIVKRDVLASLAVMQSAQPKESAHPLVTTLTTESPSLSPVTVDEVRRLEPLTKIRSAVARVLSEYTVLSSFRGVITSSAVFIDH